MGKKRVAKQNVSDGGSKSTSPPSSKDFALTNQMIFIIIGALFSAWLHHLHIWNLFENDKHFSHLSSLERDLAFRTEMGLYYSYYHTVIEAPSAFQGFKDIIYDNVTEYPSTINVIKRFNLWPELVLGISYRWFMAFTNAAEISTKQCWKVNRGDLPDVHSCEGIGDAHYFYVYSIYFLNSMMMAVIFLFGCFLSGNSILGGVLSVAFYFFNHGEATRVMWTPPLRESYSFPFLIIELLLVSYMIRINKPDYRRHMIAISAAAFLFMLPWQFAQFALLTQTACVFALYMLECIGSHKINILLHAQLVSLLANFVFQFGNEMLLTSFYASSLLAVMVIVKQEKRIESFIENLIGRCVIKTMLWLIGTFGLKKIISAAISIADDAHIWEIFKSKFTDFDNFHTMLYTCAKEFDFLELSTVVKLVKTLLIPSVILISVVVVLKFLHYEYQQYQERHAALAGGDVVGEDEESRAHRTKPNAEVLYCVLQTIAFTIMAVLIMRLKLFMTPMMCITSSLLASRKVFGFVRQKWHHNSLVFAILAIACMSGLSNLREQWNIVGEFQNWPHEEMLTFINKNLPKNGVFAGAMPTTASIKLSCQRPIVNHPHYEDAGLRARTMRVYSMYSRQELSEVRDTLEAMKVDYFVLENSWCVRKTRDGCQMPEIWDIEQPENKGKVPACAVAHNDPSPYFKEVFKNGVYTILQVNKK